MQDCQDNAIKVTSERFLPAAAVNYILKIFVTRPINWLLYVMQVLKGKKVTIDPKKAFHVSSKLWKVKNLNVRTYLH